MLGILNLKVKSLLQRAIRIILQRTKGIVSKKRSNWAVPTQSPKETLKIPYKHIGGRWEIYRKIEKLQKGTVKTLLCSFHLLLIHYYWSHWRLHFQFNRNYDQRCLHVFGHCWFWNQYYSYSLRLEITQFNQLILLS